MNSPAKRNKSFPSITAVKITENSILAEMSDGREISIPIAWFPRLAAATKTQIRHFEISPGGYGIHWPDVDEDISVKAFFE